MFYVQVQEEINKSVASEDVCKKVWQVFHAIMSWHAQVWLTVSLSMCADPGGVQGGVKVCCFRRCVHAQGLLTVSVFHVQIQEESKQVSKSVVSEDFCMYKFC